jgi:hypothetical protein
MGIGIPINQRSAPRPKPMVISSRLVFDRNNNVLGTRRFHHWLSFRTLFRSKSASTMGLCPRPPLNSPLCGQGGTTAAEAHQQGCTMAWMKASLSITGGARTKG